MALDTSYAIPIACKLFFRDHPEVNYVPGPFNLGRRGGAFVAWVAIMWTTFEVCILIMPTIYPVTATNMNYSSIITAGVMLLAGLWYLLSARHYYDGPRTTLNNPAVMTAAEREQEELDSDSKHPLT